MAKYVTRKEALKVLKIHYQTLYRMEDRGEIDVIRSKGGHRLYNLDKYLLENKTKNETIKERICYCRVSSKKQSKDLKRQMKMMEKKYPDCRIIKDIGSGLNMERKGLREIIEMGINGKIEELIIAHKDRLARFGYEMIEWIIKKYSNGKITIVNKTKNETPEEEIVKDVLQIMNVYVAKINGRRKYTIKNQ
jgi:putative resolvase